MKRLACLFALLPVALTLAACKKVPASEPPAMGDGEPETDEPEAQQAPKVDPPEQFVLTDEYACRIESGQVHCWGGSAPLPGGDETEADDHQMPIDGVTAIAIDDYRFCALNDQGAQCWGHNIDGDVPPLTEYPGDAPRIETLETPDRPVAMSAFTESGVCVLGRGGDLRCWAELELTENESVDVDYTLYASSYDMATDARMVEMGPGYACWVAIDGTVSCGGLDPIHEDDPMAAWEQCLDDVYEYGCDEYDDDEYCGDGDYSSEEECDDLEIETVSELWASPSKVEGVEGAVEVATGMSFACARLGAGGVQCWGRGENGELGTGQVEESEEPIAEPLDVKGINDAISLAAGESHACVVRRDGTLWCWGDNRMGQLGEGERALEPRRVEGLQDLASVTIQTDLTCGIGKDGSTTCFGSDGSGRVRGKRKKPRRHQLAKKGVTDVRLASSLTCLYSGKKQIGCVGKQSYTDRRPIHQRSKLSKLERGKLVDSTLYGCGLTDKQEVRCWEGLSQMQKGGPSRLVAKDVVGFSHSGKRGCAVTQGGEVTCWWQNASSGPLIVENVPGVRGAIDTASTPSSTCVLMGNGDARCFPIDRPFSELDGALSVSKLTGLKDGIAIDSTNTEFCAVTKGNKVQCWPAAAIKSPPLEHDVDATALSMASGYSCALETSGTVACWGRNYYGNVAPEQDDVTITAPTRIPNLSDVVAIETSPSHACARTKSGAVECWGRDFEGELGRQPDRFVWPPAPL